jgi:hypothetical protein
VGYYKAVREGVYIRGNEGGRGYVPHGSVFGDLPHIYII